MNMHTVNVTRRGNAMVLAVGMLALIATMIAVSTNESISVATETGHRTQQQAALAAVETVLARRELLLNQLATDDKLKTWTGAAGEEPNYGVDYVGDCAVMWKVEPARTVKKNDPNQSQDLDYIVNPSPDVDFKAVAPVQVNKLTYAFRIAAESQFLNGDEVLARAQGARYAFVSIEPLFRYVIFYAKEGPKGDLELSHGPGVKLAGGVYSNGAIYIGSGTGSNDWGVLKPASSITQIGPNELGKDVRCIGQDGIFCMSKPIMFGAYNGFNMVGANPGFGGTGTYELGIVPNDTRSIPGGTFDEVTLQGTLLNPYRVHDNAGLSTNCMGGERTINGTPITQAVDSRDLDRNLKWDPDSLTRYKKMALTRVTNAQPKKLPPALRDRPFEAQVLAYDPTPNLNDDVQEHLTATPMFIDATGGLTPLLSNAGIDNKEYGGQYIRYALGFKDAYFARNAPFTGWEVKTLANGTPGTPSVNQKVGLIIRERAVPLHAYLGTPPDTEASYANRFYVPFTYGKHKRPDTYPFTNFWITDRNSGGGSYTNEISPLGGWGNNPDPFTIRQTYLIGGQLDMACANAVGAAYSDGSNEDPNGFFRSNWRFIHLNRPAQPAPASPDYPRVVNLSPGSAQNFFYKKNDFIAVQARISSFYGGNWSTHTDGHKAGLMIMPFKDDATTPASGTDITTNGINSRTPYAAMLYSPDRGFFSQRRLEYSDLDPNEFFYTNTGADGLTYPGTEFVAEDTSARRTVFTSTSQPTRWGEPPNNVAVGTGETVFYFKAGPYTRKVASIASMQATGISMKFDLVGAASGGGFIDFDLKKRFSAFVDATATAVFTSPNGQVSTSNGEVTSHSPDNRSVQVTFNSSTLGPPVSVSSTPWMDASRATAPQDLIWRYYRDGYGNQASAEWDKAAAYFGSDAALRAALTSAGYTINESVPPLDDVPPVTAGSSADFTSDFFPNPGTCTFALARYPRQDVNSYISQRGAWYSPTTCATSSLASPATTAGSVANRIFQFVPEMPQLPVDKYATTSSIRPDMLDWNATDYTAPSAPAAAPAAGICPNPAWTRNAPWADGQEWRSGVNYVVGDVVTYLNETYRCIQANTSGASFNQIIVRRVTNAVTNKKKKGKKATNKTSSSTVTLVPITIVPNLYWEKGVSNWVRIEKLNQDPDSKVLVFKYYIGPKSKPAPSDFDEMDDGFGPSTTSCRSRADITAWPEDLLVGVAAQSGNYWDAIHVRFQDMSIETRNSIIDNKAWDSAVSTQPDPIAAYLCSQYQVFWGTKEITEDFFNYPRTEPDAVDDPPFFATDRARPATEDVFINPREFWSQSRWWNEGDPNGQIEKESGKSPNPDNRESQWRQLFARTTVLNLNMEAIQYYIAHRTLSEATTDRLATAGSYAQVGSGELLQDSFNGLIYAARTNRYPWNPTPGQPNPFNPDLPNTNDNFADLTSSPIAPDLTFTGSSPVAPLSPPIKSVDYHQGVMISNGQSIHWDDGNYPLGISKMSIVTPNQLFIKGDFNSNPNDTGSPTPVAVMGDSVTLLSNWWNFSDFQQWGLMVDDFGVLAGGTLFKQDILRGGPTTYNCCIVTNNQPTTKERVYLGESAAFVNTMQFLENWTGNTMFFKGSLAVLDTCRYTRNFLLQDKKTYGRGPFGIMGWHKSPPDWGYHAPHGGNVPFVYTPPTRDMTFNLDLMTDDGTPPFSPFSITNSGVGGWARITQ